MGIQKKDREYERFLDQISDFIFVEDKPERADIIFVPGNGFPQMSIEAARLWKEGMAASLFVIFNFFISPPPTGS